jgi:hypothetical protein
VTTTTTTTITAVVVVVVIIGISVIRSSNDVYAVAEPAATSTTTCGEPPKKTTTTTTATPIVEVLIGDAVVHRRTLHMLLHQHYGIFHYHRCYVILLYHYVANQYQHDNDHQSRRSE